MSDLYDHSIGDDSLRLRELLAVLHGDGGHHTNKVGIVQSCRDAEEMHHMRCAVVREAVSADECQNQEAREYLGSAVYSYRLAMARIYGRD